MADLKITALPNSNTIDDADLLPVVDDVAGTPVTEKRTVGQVKAHMRKQRIQSVTSATTVTPSWDTNDQVNITALAANVTLANPTGTPSPGQVMFIRFKDNGTARTIGVGSQYRAIGVTLSTTTVINKTLYWGCKWNEADSKVDVLAVGIEA